MIAYVSKDVDVMGIQECTSSHNITIHLTLQINYREVVDCSSKLVRKILIVLFRIRISLV